MKISVCVDAVFHGKDLVESVRGLRGTGVCAFEFWGWMDRDLDAIKRVKEETGLEISTFSAKVPSLVDKRKHQGCVEGLKQTLEAADKLGCKRLIATTGNDTGYPHDYQMKVLAESLAMCEPYLRDAGVTLLVEPLNPHIDHAGYFLCSSLEAFSLIDSVGSPCVKVLFDIYHQQITEGNIINNIVENIDKIGHFHSAGLPGRNELFTGELNYPEICRAISAAGYEGYFGLEYFPKSDVMAGLTKTVEMLR